MSGSSGRPLSTAYAAQALDGNACLPVNERLQSFNMQSFPLAQPRLSARTRHGQPCLCAEQAQHMHTHLCIRLHSGITFLLAHAALRSSTRAPQSHVTFKPELRQDCIQGTQR